MGGVVDAVECVKVVDGVFARLDLELERFGGVHPGGGHRVAQPEWSFDRSLLQRT